MATNVWLPVYKLVDSKLEHFSDFAGLKAAGYKVSWQDNTTDKAILKVYKSPETDESIILKWFPLRYTIQKMLNFEWKYAGSAFDFEAKDALKQLFPKYPMKPIKEAGANVFIEDRADYPVIYRVKYTEMETKYFYSLDRKLNNA